MTPPSRNSTDWPVHQPEATDAPIPGRQWYAGCEPGGDWDSETGRYEGTGPRLNPITGLCTACGRPGCRVCGRQDCPDHDPADQAHAAAEELEPDATRAEVLAVLAAYKAAWWSDGRPLHAGTIAWFLADFLPAWLAPHAGVNGPIRQAQDQAHELLALTIPAEGGRQFVDRADFDRCLAFLADLTGDDQWDFLKPDASRTPTNGVA